jgi:hypothetical protein
MTHEFQSQHYVISRYGYLPNSNCGGGTRTCERIECPVRNAAVLEPTHEEHSFKPHPRPSLLQLHVELAASTQESRFDRNDDALPPRQESAARLNGPNIRISLSQALFAGACFEPMVAARS